MGEEATLPVGKYQKFDTTLGLTAATIDETFYVATGK